MKRAQRPRLAQARAFVAAALIALTLLPCRAIAADTADELRSAVAGGWRADENRARDRYRHPLQTLEFFRVSPDATLIEITPGGGWYAEILAPFLRERGKYVAAVAAPEKSAPELRDYLATANARLAEKFRADPPHYARAAIVEFDAAAPDFGKPASADTVVTFRNVHNWVKSGNADAYFRAFFTVLKPGGTLGVEDHRARAGSALDIDSGYLPEDYVIKLATAAGFELAERSEINANPADTKDYPKGVWTLPPTLILGDQDKAKYLAIGESDRFTLRFVKPRR